MTELSIENAFNHILCFVEIRYVWWRQCYIDIRISCAKLALTDLHKTFPSQEISYARKRAYENVLTCPRARHRSMWGS